MNDTRYYGGNKTIHHTNDLNIELYDGKVVAVWFRCQCLPFDQTEVEHDRATDMIRCYNENTMPNIIGLELEDL